MLFYAASRSARREWHADREVLRLGNEQGRLAPLRVERAKRLDRQIHIEQSLGHPGRAGALQLRRDVADHTVVRVAGTAVGTPGDHDVGAQALDFFRDAFGEPRHQAAIADVVAEFSVGEAEENGRSGAEGGGRALRLVGTRVRERVAAGPESGRTRYCPCDPLPAEPSLATIK